jgi:7-keto-8-aminopelargonate synthetase-like enzyme
MAQVIDQNQDKLVQMGLTLTKSETPIVPILIGEEEKAQALSDLLLTRGVFARGNHFPLTQAEALLRLNGLLPGPGQAPLLYAPP